MKLIITLNQKGLDSNYMSASDTNYTLTALYMEMGDVLRDHLQYYPDMLCDTYYENDGSDESEKYEDLENSNEIEFRFIEMANISLAIDDVLDGISKLSRIFDKINKNEDEANRLIFDPFIFVCIDGDIKEDIITKMNNYFIRNTMTLEAVDMLDIYGLKDNFGAFREMMIKTNNLSELYDDDSLVLAYTLATILDSNNNKILFD